MNNETCIHGGISPVSLLQNLHHNQGGSGRHHCPTCAFEEGFILGSSNKWKNYDDYCSVLTDDEKCPQGSVASSIILKSLGVNQGGTGRHKCTNCAFKEGFKLGLLNSNSTTTSLTLVTPPKIKPTKRKRTFQPHKSTDFIKKELQNKKLGLLGEIAVLNSEIAYLTNNNRTDLANLVEHSSVVHGDGLGYDILSYDTKGNKKLIEVKTTRGAKSRPFHISRNEVERSKVDNTNFYLYRLFDFDTNSNAGEYYIVKGDLSTKLNLEAIEYLGSPI
ncbi:protein NO VEIN domain-containing protein [Polaribacter sp. OB-PA-B3]